MTIKNFEPENTKDKLYIRSEYIMTLDDLIDQAASHFKIGVVDLIKNFTISSEYIHTHCITYDLYVPGDYTNFIVIERK